MMVRAHVGIAPEELGSAMAVVCEVVCSLPEAWEPVGCTMGKT
jgi:hypothetical protein